MLNFTSRLKFRQIRFIRQRIFLQPEFKSMADNNEQIKQLLARLDKMVEYQGYFFREITSIREEIKKLRTIQPKPSVFAPTETPKKPIPREEISPVHISSHRRNRFVRTNFDQTFLLRHR